MKSSIFTLVISILSFIVYSQNTTNNQTKLAEGRVELASDTSSDEQGSWINPTYTIGTKWTYEFICNIPPQIGYFTYEITDTLSFKNLSCYVINTEGTICLSGNKVYAIDYRLTDSLQLLYDYDATTSIEFECFERNLGISTYEIKIDSVYEEIIADGQVLQVSEVATFCGGGSFGNFRTKIYHGIGSSIISPFECLDFCNDIADPVTCEVFGLRCFDNGIESYRFVDYPCDTIWQLVNVNDIESEKFEVFPNPASSDFTITFTDVKKNYNIKLMDMTGRMLWQRTPKASMNFSTDEYERGVYILKLENEFGKLIHLEKLIVVK